MFSVKVDKGTFKVKEVAATRAEFTESPYKFDTEVKQTYQEGLIKCAIVQGAFFFWPNDSQSGKTKDIKASGSSGFANWKALRPANRNALHWPTYVQVPVSKTTRASRRNRCTAKEIDLCSRRFNFNVHEPVNGAICISVPYEVEFLTEPWVRFTLRRYGNALSFKSWVEPEQPDSSKIARN